MKPIKKAAVLHDMCSVGKAAMTNILPVLSVMGIEVCPVLTMLLSTHTGGYGRPVIRRQNGFIQEAAVHFKEQQVTFDYILVGYLGSPDLIKEAQDFLLSFPDACVILDPIMGDHGEYYSNFDHSYCERLSGLLPMSGLITPNFTEACFLAGISGREGEALTEVSHIAEQLQEKGCKNGVITSVPIPGYQNSIYLWEEGKPAVLLKKSCMGGDYHGTGDIFSAVLLGELAKGSELTQACEAAHSFVVSCIELSEQYDYPEREGVLLEPLLGKLLKKHE